MATYKALAKFDPPKIDFLLPHGTWVPPSPGHMLGPGEAPHADWLIGIFHHWYYAPDPGVRLFEDIMRLLPGAAAASEAPALSPQRIVFIETGGVVELADDIKLIGHIRGTMRADIAERRKRQALG